MKKGMSTEIEQHGRFRLCAETHGLRLHRIHLLAATRDGGFSSTQVFDCACGQRWLLRINQAEVVSVDSTVITSLRETREGQPTAPPGFPGAPARAARS
jgi:hypothetical protein